MLNFFRRDKRAQYRVRAAHGDALRGFLVEEEQEPQELVLLDTSAGGCGLLMSAREAKAFPVGRELTVRFERPDTKPRETAVVVRRQKEDNQSGGMVVGCEITDKDAFWKSLNRSWWTYFNRRGALRVPREPAEPMRGRAIVEGLSGDAELQDLSVSGVAMRFPSVVAANTRVGGRGRVFLQLEGPESEQLSFSVTTIHVTVVRSIGIVGMHFDAERTSNFAAKEEALSRWFSAWQMRSRAEQ
ncbi:MAG: PilZ domain-containing protein [Planctomycetota bacterium]